MALSWISGPTIAGRASSSPENRHTFTDADAAAASATADTAAAAAADAHKSVAADETVDNTSINSLSSGMVIVEEWERTEEQNEELGCAVNGFSASSPSFDDGDGSDGNQSSARQEIVSVPSTTAELVADTPPPPLPPHSSTTTATDAATLMQHVEAMAAEVTRQFNGQTASDHTTNGGDEGQSSSASAAAGGASEEGASGEVAGFGGAFGDEDDEDDGAMDDFEGMD